MKLVGGIALAGTGDFIKELQNRPPDGAQVSLTT